MQLNFISKSIIVEVSKFLAKFHFSRKEKDGSTYQLPYEEELIRAFKTCDNGQGQPICMAQGTKIYDVLNKITIASAFHPYNTKGSKGNSEKALFNKYLKQLPQLIDNEAHKAINIVK